MSAGFLAMKSLRRVLRPMRTMDATFREIILRGIEKLAHGGC